MTVLRARVLVVDDEPSICRVFQRQFRRDFEVCAASSVDEALNLLGQQRFDVAIVDYAMPHANGLELLRRVSAGGSRMPCFLVTAHADLPDVQDAVATGLARAVLPKPWRSADVLNAIRVALADRFAKLDMSRVELPRQNRK